MTGKAVKTMLAILTAVSALTAAMTICSKRTEKQLEDASDCKSEAIAMEESLSSLEKEREEELASLEDQNSWIIKICEIWERETKELEDIIGP